MSLDESDWCEIFYLHVDTNMEDVGENLRVIEVFGISDIMTQSMALQINTSVRQNAIKKIIRL